MYFELYNLQDSATATAQRSLFQQNDVKMCRASATVSNTTLQHRTEEGRAPAVAVTYTHIHEQMHSSLVNSNLLPEGTLQPELDLIEKGCQAGGSTATVDNAAGARFTVLHPKTFSGRQQSQTTRQGHCQFYQCNLRPWTSMTTKRRHYDRRQQRGEQSCCCPIAYYVYISLSLLRRPAMIGR